VGQNCYPLAQSREVEHPSRVANVTQRLTEGRSLQYIVRNEFEAGLGLNSAVLSSRPESVPLCHALHLAHVSRAAALRLASEFAEGCPMIVATTMVSPRFFDLQPHGRSGNPILRETAPPATHHTTTFFP